MNYQLLTRRDLNYDRILAQSDQNNYIHWLLFSGAAQGLEQAIENPWNPTWDFQASKLNFVQIYQCKRQ